MATIGALKVQLTARTASFVRGMARAGRTVRNFSRTATSAVGRVARFATAFGGLGTILAGAGISALATKAASDLDRLGKTADKLGATTGGLATLRLMAKLSGVEIKSFDVALQRVTRRTAEAAQGLGKTGQTISDLGLDAKKLLALPGDEMIVELLKGLGGIQSAAMRVQKAFKLFDTEGVGLVNMIENATQKLDEFRAIAKDIGIIFTRDQLKLVEDMNDQFYLLRTKMSAIVQHALIKVSPILTTVFKRLRESMGDPAKAADWLIGKVKAIGTALLTALDVAAPTLIRMATVIANALQLVLDIIESIATLVRRDIPESFTSAREQLAKFTLWLDKQLTSVEEGGGWGKRLINVFREAARKLQADAQTFAKGMSPWERLLGGLETGATRTATVGLAPPSAFGGATVWGAGARPRVAGWASGTVELRVQNDQLDELKKIERNTKKIEPKGRLGN